MNVVWERKGTKITISAAKESGLHLLIGHSTPLEDKGLWGGDNFGFSGVYLKDKAAVMASKKFYEEGGFGSLEPHPSFSRQGQPEASE